MMPRPGQNTNDPEFQKALHLWKQQNNISDSSTQTVKSGVAPLPRRSAYKGYGDFINLPPGAIVDRRFVDRDRDGIDDRYQTGPGKPSNGGPKTKPKRKRELGRKTTPLGYLAANNLSAEKTNIGGMPR